LSDDISRKRNVGSVARGTRAQLAVAECRTNHQEIESGLPERRKQIPALHLRNDQERAPK